jgi:hydrogenase-4 component E
MEQLIAPQILSIAELLIFLSVIAMHLAKKSIYAVYFYTAQSILISLLLIISAASNNSAPLLLVAVIIFIVKALIAPGFFMKLIKKHRLKFSASTYLNLPMTLAGLTLITAATYSKFFDPLVTLNPTNESAILTSVAVMFISLFLIINRKGALSQMIGVLSLENAIVSFAFAAGFEQGPGLELGIIFDIFVWIIIATVFVSMIYKKFETLDVTEMTHLKG